MKEIIYIIIVFGQVRHVMRDKEKAESIFEKIYNYEISVAKIASKAKVKSTVKEYLENIKKPNKAGNDAPRKAHMELIIANNLSVGLGDTIYYVNTGKKKSDGDIKTKISIWKNLTS